MEKHITANCPLRARSSGTCSAHLTHAPFHQPLGWDVTMTSILQMKKLWLRDVEQPAQSHRAVLYYRQDLTPKPALFTTHLDNLTGLDSNQQDSLICPDI